MVPTPFEQVTKESIEQLVQSRAPEDKVLEYKLDLPGKGDKERTEFLADVSSFANAGGGCILYGIKEARQEDNEHLGYAEEAVGIEDLNVDATKLRLENFLRDGVDPRIAGIQMKAVEGFPKGPVFVVHIPKSWNPPHMVRGAYRYYIRMNAGKAPMDATEVRSAVLHGEELTRRIQHFRDERLSKILSDEVPVDTLLSKRRLIMHLVPLSSLASNVQLGGHAMFQACTRLDFPGLCGRTSRPNLDGVLNLSHQNDHVTLYVQLFRTGAIEYVDSLHLDLGRARASVNVMIHMLDQFRKLLTKLEITPPVFLFITLTGVRGAVIEDLYDLSSDPIDRDMMTLPDVQIDDLRTRSESILRPALDVLWQAAGMVGCPFYDTNGDWKVVQ